MGPRVIDVPADDPSWGAKVRAYGFREQGSRDFRMLPAAFAVWTSSLATHGVWAMVMDACSQEATNGATIPRTPWQLTACVLPVAALAAVLCVMSRRSPGMATVVASAMMMASAATLVSDVSQWHDSAFVLSRQGSTGVSAQAQVTAPMMTSSRRGYDCQADAVLRTIRYAQPDAPDARTLVEPSRAPVRLFASGSSCRALLQDVTVRITGELSRAQYGGRPLWLAADGSDVVTLRGQGWLRRVISSMQEAFFDVTERLNDQGRILVPGLTLGMLGHEHVPVHAGAGEDRTIDEHYARNVEDRFKRSGIMHLMAVSGGHFALVADMVRRLCSRLLLHRRIVACCVAASYVLLSMLMFPSDSVLRALIMGLIGAAALFVGRRGQSVSALCWTVIAVLMAAPSMARSYGFALSCAAVLGIVMFSKPVARWLEGPLPRPVAGSLSLTVSAQSLTLPIQVLMEPELPLASIPANLMVGPFVDVATLAGLAALMTSMIDRRLALPLAWLSSCGTRVMDGVAAWLSSGRYAVVPWAGGVAGATLMLAAQAMLVTLIAVGTGLMRRRSMAHASRYGLEYASPSHGSTSGTDDTRRSGAPSGRGIQSSGAPYRRRRRDRIAAWLAETRRMFDKEE